MHHIEPYEHYQAAYCIVLKDAAEGDLVLATARGLLRSIPLFRSIRYTNFRHSWCDGYDKIVLLDAWGEPVAPEAFDLVPRQRIRVINRWFPGSKRRGGRWYRSPRTLPARRADFVDPDAAELGLGGRSRARPKRSVRGMPTDWDDLPLRRQRNWKKQRKTQYRVKRGR